MNVNEYIEIEIERSMIEKSKRPDCKNPECGGFGDGWGSLGGFCTRHKHAENVGCKCILEGCSEIYWSKSSEEKRIANKRGKA
jgi:hypothetical protein